MEYNEAEGVWRTVRGRRVFIRSGQTVHEAIQESLHYHSGQHDRIFLEKQEYAHVMSELNTYYESFKDKFLVAWPVAPNIYFFENYMFNEYVIFDKLELKKEPELYNLYWEEEL